MNILVLGGAGYIGSAFTRRALRENHTVTVFDNFLLGHREALPPDPNLSIRTGDVRDQTALLAAINETAPEAVLHFAALALVGESMSSPKEYYDVNVGGMSALLSALHASKRESLPVIFSSTCAVFGAPSNLPMRETDPKAPFSPYGRTKLACEFLLEDYSRAYGGRGIALRYFNACGADPDGAYGEDHSPETHLIPNALRAVVLGHPVDILGTNYPTRDGTCVRDYIHVDDLATAHLAAAQFAATMANSSFEDMHLGTGTGHTVLEVLDEAERVTQTTIQRRLLDRRPGDPPELYASPEKAARLLSFTPVRSTLSDIIASAWRWHQSHPHGYRQRASTKPGEDSCCPVLH